MDNIEKLELKNKIFEHLKTDAEAKLSTAYLNKTFKIAVSDRIITYNPMESESIKKPKSNKEDKKVNALTIEEHKKLIDVLEKN